MPEVDLRILQANERTLLAWIRTGLALMAFGFVLARLAVWLRIEHPDRVSPASAWIGLTMLVLGVACHVIGALRFVKARRAILAGETIHPGSLTPVAVAIVVAVVGVAAVVYVAAEA